jgi:hypothetical protein
MSYFSRNMDPEDIKKKAEVIIHKKITENRVIPIAAFHSILDPDQIIETAINILDRKFSIKVIPPDIEE